MVVVRRDGTEVPFNRKKIIRAITKAGFVEDSVKQRIASYVESLNRDKITVEQIQDIVEQKLMASSYKSVAKEYIRYRYKREMIRKNEDTNRSILDIVSNKNGDVSEENSNKNPTIASTQRDYIAGEVSKDLTMRLLLPDDVVDAHRNGIIHFHDADYFVQSIFNCCLINLEDMLQNGTVISGTMIEKPHSFATACNIATQIIAQVASNQYGGQSINIAHLAPFVDISRQKLRNDVHKEFYDMMQSDDLDVMPSKEVINRIAENRLKDEIKRGVQTIQYQVLTLMTTNGQTPFITVFLYLGDIEDGQTRDDLALIIEEIIRQRYQGTKNEQGIWITPAFPKLIYVLEEDNITPDSKYWYLTELAAKCSAKRLVPDYLSEKMLLEHKYPKDKILPIKTRRDMWGDEHIWGENPFKNLSDAECDILQSYVDKNGKDVPEAEDIMHKYGIKRGAVIPKAFAPMGCRSFLTPDYIHYRTWGRFNQGVVTINLPDIALQAVKDFKDFGDTYVDDKDRENKIKDRFWNLFDERLELCHRALQIRHQQLEYTTSYISPIHWRYGAIARLDKGETIDKLLHDNFSTLSLGYAGLYECVKAITGKSHTDDEAKPFALEIMQHMNDKCAEWREKENVSYSLYGTPIESTTYKFAKALKDRFGVIEGITDHDYITNSYHVNVREKIDPMEKLHFESEFQRLSPGGAISYIETSNLSNNLDAVLEVIKYIYDNIVYAELNTKSDYCMECGFDGEIKIVTDEKTGRLVWECPKCGNRDQKKMSVARRTCGYIGSQFWNQGRTEEIKDRFVHLGNDIDLD